ncbi:MAG: hypothetical protein WCD18_10105 [Thermosynechococcaceae cyanobacterium]
MPIQYTNKKGQIFYLHQGTTKTGKPKYFFSMKGDGILVDEVPDGFEIHETPNAQVFLRRIEPAIITDSEKTIVEEGMKIYSKLKYYQIEIKKNKIIIFQADQNIDNLSELFGSMPNIKQENLVKMLTRSISYSPMMRFVLIDKVTREFQVERYCFLGRVDDWIVIDAMGQLQKLVKKYVKHLGQESYYELF